MKIKKILVAGSGANGMQLTGTLDDIRPWRQVDVEKYQWSVMAVGGMFSMANDVDGRVYLWGNFNNKIIQEPIVVMSKAWRVWCGWEHAVILTKEGDLYGIGCNKYNQLSSAKRQYFEEPEIILKNRKVEDVLCGFRQTYVICDDIMARGSNRSGQLGNNVADEDGWINLGKLNKIKKMQCSKRCLFVLTQDKTLLVMGNNKIIPKIPQKVLQFTPFYENVDDFSSGWNHVAIHSNGQVRSYGSNTLGQLGHDETTDIVDLPKGQYQLTSGTEFTFAIGQDAVYGWGWNEHANISDHKQGIISRPIKIMEGSMPLLTHSASTFLILPSEAK